jgi:hypothetical protein
MRIRDEEAALDPVSRPNGVGNSDKLLLVRGRQDSSLLDCRLSRETILNLQGGGYLTLSLAHFSYLVAGCLGRAEDIDNPILHDAPVHSSLLGALALRG